jgi:dihydropteroate synthase
MDSLPGCAAVKDDFRPLLMGILNVTPDSFFDGGRYNSPDLALKRAMQIVEEGADIIDIGGESTRPGSDPVPAQEEIDRVCPVIEAIRRETSLPISVDTTKASVAEESLRLGASMVNDISGGVFDPGILDVAARYGSDIVLMHTKGEPGAMQCNPEYADLLGEIRDYLADSVKAALASGISPEKIILDPGLGFGKTLEDNYRILKNLAEFKKNGYRLLIGLSRKSMIGKLYCGEDDRLPATIALNTIALQNGADIIRVHDVRAHRLAMTAIYKLHEVS